MSKQRAEPIRRVLGPHGEISAGAPLASPVLQATGLGIRLTDLGRQWLLDRAMHGAGGTAADLDYHLYQLNITPAHTDVNSTYSGAEANYTGYAALRANAWGLSTAVSTARVTVSTALTFAVGASPSVTNSIFGYYVTAHSLTDILWAERFPSAPWAMTTDGQQIVITPYLSAISQAA